MRQWCAVYHCILTARYRYHCFANAVTVVGMSENYFLLRNKNRNKDLRNKYYSYGFYHTILPIENVLSPLTLPHLPSRIKWPFQYSGHMSLAQGDHYMNIRN